MEFVELKLNKLFIDYINYGGYPEVVFSEEIRENPGQFIRHDIIDKVLLRDLPSLYGISDVQELNSLFTMIAYHSGAQFSYEKLSKESGVKKETLKKYINVSSTKTCRDAFLRLSKQDCRIKSPVAKTWQLAETQECVSTVW